MEELDTILILDALKEKFNSTNIRELCLRLNIEIENLSQNNHVDRVIDLIKYAQRHDKLNSLHSVMMEINPTYKAQSSVRYKRLKSLVTGEEVIDEGFFLPNDNWHFENRNSELNRIQINRFFYISEPAGYGKTAFIKKAAQTLLENGVVRRYFYIDAKELGKEIHCLNTDDCIPLRNFDSDTVFILDCLENITAEGKKVSSALIKKVLEFNNHSHHLILAGRYLKPEHIKSIGLPLEKQKRLTLSALEKSIVSKFISDQARKSDPDRPNLLAPLNTWTDDIDELSCGHPGFIRKWVEKLKQEQWSPAFPGARKIEIFEKFFYEEIGHILRHKGQTQDFPLKDVLEVLSIFSMFDSGIITRLKLDGIIDANVDPLSTLQNLKLICEKEKGHMGFYGDSILRALFLKKMELLDINRLNNLIESAIKILVDLIETSVKAQQETSYEIRIYVRELFYVHFLGFRISNAHKTENNEASEAERLKELAKAVRDRIHGIFGEKRYSRFLNSLLSEVLESEDIADILNIYLISPGELLAEWGVREEL